MTEHPEPDLRALLKAEQEQRVAACQAAIEAVLAEHRCAFDLSVTLRANSVTPQLALVAKD